MPHARGADASPREGWLQSRLVLDLGEDGLGCWTYVVYTQIPDMAGKPSLTLYERI